MDFGADFELFGLVEFLNTPQETNWYFENLLLTAMNSKSVELLGAHDMRHALRVRRRWLFGWLVGWLVGWLLVGGGY